MRTTGTSGKWHVITGHCVALQERAANAHGSCTVQFQYASNLRYDDRNVGERHHLHNRMHRGQLHRMHSSATYGGADSSRVRRLRHDGSLGSHHSVHSPQQLGA